MNYIYFTVCIATIGMAVLAAANPPKPKPPPTVAKMTTVKPPKGPASKTAPLKVCTMKPCDNSNPETQCKSYCPRSDPDMKPIQAVRSSVENCRNCSPPGYLCDKTVVCCANDYKCPLEGKATVGRCPPALKEGDTCVTHVGVNSCGPGLTCVVNNPTTMIILTQVGKCQKAPPSPTDNPKVFTDATGTTKPRCVMEPQPKFMGYLNLKRPAPEFCTGGAGTETPFRYVCPKDKNCAVCAPAGAKCNATLPCCTNDGGVKKCDSPGTCEIGEVEGQLCWMGSKSCGQYKKCDFIGKEGNYELENEFPIKPPYMGICVSIVAGANLDTAFAPGDGVSCLETLKG